MTSSERARSESGGGEGGEEGADREEAEQSKIRGRGSHGVRQETLIDSDVSLHELRQGLGISWGGKEERREKKEEDDERATGKREGSLSLLLLFAPRVVYHAPARELDSPV